MSNKPLPHGEYLVGTFTYTVKDDREEILDPPNKRSIAARVYYAILKGSEVGDKKIKGISENMAKGISTAFKIPMNYKKIEAGDNTSECYENAPRIEGKKFPLIVFNHGLGSYREGNSFLCIELASHGYVVISVTHSREAACTEFDDGSSVMFDKKILSESTKPFWGAVIASMKLQKFKGTLEETAQKFDEFQRKFSMFLFNRVEEWEKDINSAIDHAKQNYSDLIDWDLGIGISGHSMGGNLAYRFCVKDDRFVCGVNIDGGIFGETKDYVLRKPFLQVSCKDNQTIVSRVYLKHTKPVYKALFRDMRHMGFSDMKHAMKPGMISGRLDPDKMHENLCALHLEMFDTYLKRIKDVPAMESNDTITVTKFDPDM